MISIQTEKCESVSSSATYIIQSVQQIIIIIIIRHPEE